MVYDHCVFAVSPNKNNVVLLTINDTGSRGGEWRIGLALK